MRETTKEFVGGKITRIVGGTSTIEAESIDIWADNITFTAGNKNIFTSEKGIVFGDYTPPEEVYTKHPKVEKVEFFDENGNLLNQNTKDFYYGQKLKIKVTTKNAKDGEMLYIQLKGKSKSKNQKFDLMDGSGFRWGFVPIKDNQYETSFFVLNPNWYSDDKENYNYSTHETEIKEDDLNEFYALVTLNAKDVYLPLEGQRLKPITYKRNYEELIGLFKTDNSGEKDLLENYENLYINKYADENEDIKDIVDDFSEWLCEDNPEATINEIETKVAESAKKLWENAVWQHKDHINTITTTNKETGEKKEEKKERKAILDDRPLYWARIAMQVILKRQYVFTKDILTLPQDQQDLFFKKSIIPKASKLAEVIQLFEENSRNYNGINFNSPEAAGCKKVLITGFDPFLLNSIDHPDKEYYNIKQSNPSGVVALALDNNGMLGAYIQSMVIPVRYTDFDSSQENDKGQGEGIIEEYIKRFINEVDMIVTISQAGPNDYHIDVFATATRGGGDDNMNFTRAKDKSVSNSCPETIVTKLPLKMIQGNSKAIYWGEYFLTEQDQIDFYRNGDISKQKQSNTTNYPQNKIYSGPGGNYLSNEIFYRVAKMRNELKPALKTGHFHIAKIQEARAKEDLKPAKIKEVLNIVEQTLLEGIKGI